MELIFSGLFLSIYLPGILSFPGYGIETENNSNVARVAIYINNSIQYSRRCDLEGVDSNLMIIDLAGAINIRLINIYRSYSPQHGIGQREKFNDQLDHIARAWTPNTIILGDFNLDWAKRHCQNYALKNFSNDMDDRIGNLNLIQIA